MNVAGLRALIRCFQVQLRDQELKTLRRTPRRRKTTGPGFRGIRSFGGAFEVVRMLRACTMLMVSLAPPWKTLLRLSRVTGPRFSLRKLWTGPCGL
eukprot:389805-Pyramimonas_sp.AAC.1